METKTKLVLSFRSSAEKKVSLSIDSPRVDVTEDEILNAMNLIITNDVFAVNHGEYLVALLDAKIVTTDTQEFDLVI